MMTNEDKTCKVCGKIVTNIEAWLRDWVDPLDYKAAFEKLRENVSKAYELATQLVKQRENTTGIVNGNDVTKLQEFLLETLKEAYVHERIAVCESIQKGGL